MTLQKKARNPFVRLLGASSVIVGSVCYGALSGDVVSPAVPIAKSGLDIFKSGLDVLEKVAPEIFGGAFQELFVNKTPNDEILKNGDLSRAIGRAIFLLCGNLAEDTFDKNDRKSLQTLSNTKLEVWENLLSGGGYEENYGLTLSDIDLTPLSPEESTKYFQAEEGKLDEITTLTPQTWKSIIRTLCDKNKCSLSLETEKELSEKLHQEFARALRKILIDDFSTDGKAFASMQFRILSEVLFYTKENCHLTDSILPIVIEILKKVDKINQTAPPNYTPENKESWEKIFADFDSFIELQRKTYENTVKIIEEQQKQGTQLDRIETNQEILIQMNQVQVGSFIPFVVDIEREIEEMIDRFSKKAKSKLSHFCRLTNHPINENQIIENYYYEISMVKKRIE